MVRSRYIRVEEKGRPVLVITRDEAIGVIRRVTVGSDLGDGDFLGDEVMEQGGARGPVPTDGGAVKA